MFVRKYRHAPELSEENLDEKLSHSKQCSLKMHQNTPFQKIIFFWGNGIVFPTLYCPPNFVGPGNTPDSGNFFTDMVHGTRSFTVKTAVKELVETNRGQLLSVVFAQE